MMGPLWLAVLKAEEMVNDGVIASWVVTSRLSRKIKYLSGKAKVFTRNNKNSEEGYVEIAKIFLYK